MRTTKACETDVFASNYSVFAMGVLASAALLLILTRFYEVDGASGTKWAEVSGRLQSVGIGDSGVWGVTANSAIFFRRGTQYHLDTAGPSWVQVPGQLSQLSVGHGVLWGVNVLFFIFVRRGITTLTPEGTHWERISGSLKQISVNTHTNEVWGVNSNNVIYRRQGITSTNYVGTSWQQLDGSLTSVSAGHAGVWGTNSANAIYYRVGTGNGIGTAGDSWVQVPGSLVRISVGIGIIWGINGGGLIFIRLGITVSNPTGVGWNRIPGQLAHISVNPTTNHVWGVNSGGVIYRRHGVVSPIHGHPVTGNLPHLGTNWRNIPLTAIHVDVGAAGVWVIGSNGNIYVRSYTQGPADVDGVSWLLVGGRLIQLSVGKGVVWGVNSGFNTFIRIGITRDAPTGTGWTNAGRQLQQISVNSETNEVWGVSPSNEIFRRTGIVSTCGHSNLFGTGWERVEGQLKVVSTGGAGVWGVSPTNAIFYRLDTNNYGQLGSGTSWVHVPGSLAWISSGDGYVWGVAPDFTIFVRIGITACVTYAHRNGVGIPRSLCSIQCEPSKGHVDGGTQTQCMY
ncbi:PREDICTED: tectonin beta-propeller repeat-containing protein-like [Priapulus caudatus]|uniref:Tectonin beta-propeller repeat-containing protein-like n=1 Tax=Priapulus caudatus TaxID=37621 RepID=A0ABM1FBG8_PRICU|nr:PREDICTED: tectonin beta-propeller repeat-containing protein-like [Priapulus caudatus]